MEKNINLDGYMFEILMSDIIYLGVFFLKKIKFWESEFGNLEVFSEKKTQTELESISEALTIRWI